MSNRETVAEAIVRLEALPVLSEEEAEVLAFLRGSRPSAFASPAFAVVRRRRAVVAEASRDYVVRVENGPLVDYAVLVVAANDAEAVRKAGAAGGQDPADGTGLYNELMADGSDRQLVR